MLLHYITDVPSPRIKEELRAPLTARLQLAVDRQAADGATMAAARAYLPWVMTARISQGSKFPDIHYTSDAMDFLEPLLDWWSKPVFTVQPFDNWAQGQAERQAWPEREWGALQLPGTPPDRMRLRKNWQRADGRLHQMTNRHDKIPLQIYRISPSRNYYTSPITETDRHIRALVRQP